MNGKHQQRIAAFAFGVVFLSALLAIAIFIPHPADFQIYVFRIVLAIAAAGVAAMIPGVLNVSVADWVRAGGAIAVFVIIYAVNPPSLVTEAESEHDQKPSRTAATPAPEPSEVRADAASQAQTREIQGAQEPSGDRDDASLNSADQTLNAECARSPSYDGLERVMRLGLEAQATVRLGADERSRSEALEQLSLAVRCLQEFKARGYESTDSERFLRDAESELTASR